MVRDCEKAQLFVKRTSRVGEFLGAERWSFE